MPWLPKKRVVVPFDFSDSSRDAIQVAQQMVDDPAHIHVVHVLATLHAGDPGVIWDKVDDHARADHVRTSFAAAMGEGSEKFNLHVRVGRSSAVIIDFADEIDADLIVISSHGRSGLARLALGSVAEKVVRLAHCPVLVLRR